MQAQQFSFNPLKLFGESGATTAEIDDEVSRWLETHHPIEIFDKQMPYPSNFYTSANKKYGTLREVLNSLQSEFSYSNVMQRYADLLAENQPVSVEPITFFIECLEEKRILENGQNVAQDEIRSAQDAGEMIEILSNCKQPGINPVMSDYIDYLQAKFIEFMMRYTSYARYERKIVLQYNFEHLIIPFLQELTNLNRNPKGHDFIRSKLTIVRLGRDRMTDFPVLVNFIWGEGRKGGPNETNYNQTRKLLMDKHRAPAQAAQAGIDEILARVDRDVAARAAELAKAERKAIELAKAERKANDSQSAFIKADQSGYRGVATNGDTSKMFMMNLDGFGGKRTKKRKQKRSTNKKRRIHKKRGRMSKRR
jgi:hypothetical protein